MIEGWRISRANLSSEAFTGEGARLYGGRWNNPGIPLVYLAGSRSLAILEILAHLGTPSPLNQYVLFQVTFRESQMTVLPEDELPANWQAEPPESETKAIGDRWVATGSRPVLSVPSAVVPEERNYLLNPNHEQFSLITIGPPIPYKIDPRLL